MVLSIILAPKIHTTTTGSSILVLIPQHILQLIPIVALLTTIVIAPVVVRIIVITSIIALIVAITVINYSISIAVAVIVCTNVAIL